MDSLSTGYCTHEGMVTIGKFLISVVLVYAGAFCVRGECDIDTFQTWMVVGYSMFVVLCFSCYYYRILSKDFMFSMFF
jgi:hypothetical protein